MCPTPHKVWGPQEPAHPAQGPCWFPGGLGPGLSQAGISGLRSHQTVTGEVSRPAGAVPQAGAPLWSLEPSHSLFNISHEDILREEWPHPLPPEAEVGQEGTGKGEIAMGHSGSLVNTNGPECSQHTRNWAPTPWRQSHPGVGWMVRHQEVMELAQVR